jgi:hypothetical protein
MHWSINETTPIPPNNSMQRTALRAARTAELSCCYSLCCSVVALRRPNKSLEQQVGWVKPTIND